MEFKAATLHHKGSTAPGATVLTYDMVKGWSAPVLERVHGLLTLAFSGPIPPGYNEDGSVQSPKIPKMESPWTASAR